MLTKVLNESFSEDRQHPDRLMGADLPPRAARSNLICNQRHLLHALREYEAFYNGHRPHQGMANARPLQPLPELTTDPDRLTRLDIRRRDRLGGIMHEYEQAA